MISRYYAIQSLLKNNITSLPITSSKIEAILSSYGYSIIYYDIGYDKHIQILKNYGIYNLAKRTKAFTYKSLDNRLVFVRANVSASERRILLAHELGHIEMEHISENKILAYNPIGLIDDKREDEANVFAMEFVAPICILDRKRCADIYSVSSETLLDDKRARMVVDEINSHKKFTEYELKLCRAFEEKEDMRSGLYKVHNKIIHIENICFLLSAIISIIALILAILK